MADLSDYIKPLLLDHIFGQSAFTMPADVYISFHTGDPGGTGANEAAGMTRQNLETALSPASGGAITSDVVIEVTSSHGSDQTISWAGVWDASSGGNFLVRAEAVTPKVISNGDVVRIPVGDFDWSLA